MKRNKLVWQIVICLIISGIAVYGGKIKNEKISYIFDEAKAQVMHQLTLDEIKNAGKKVASVFIEMPGQMVSAVVKANNASKYGAPIDEKSDTQIKRVHATAGGMVISSGKDDKYGLYIKIMHEDAISIYGNLSDIHVIESERVQRGEIIGSYDSNQKKDFYYELKEN